MSVAKRKPKSRSIKNKPSVPVSVTSSFHCGYPIVSVAGEGTYAKVYEIIDGGVKKALRVPKNDTSGYNKTGIESPLEIDILTRIRHPNLMYAESIFHETSCNGISMILPYAPLNLTTYIKEYESDPTERLTICFQIMCAVRHLLTSNILHLDIKPDNVLLYEESGSYSPLLSDFGMAIRMDDPRIPVTITRKVITANFRPYELFVSDEKNPSQVGEHTLVWQVGMFILFTMNSVLAEGNTEEKIKEYIETYLTDIKSSDQIKRSLISYFDEFPHEPIKDGLINLLQGMLVTDITQRITLDTALSHSVWALLTTNQGQPLVIKGKNIKTSVPKAQQIDCNGSIERIFTFILYLSKFSNFNDVPSGILFAAVDLIYRSIYLVIDRSSKALIAHNIACLLIAWKLYYYRVNDEVIDLQRGKNIFVTTNAYAKCYNVDMKDVLDMENNIILHLGGKLCSQHIFDRIDDNDLDKCVNVLFVDKNSYFAFNESTFIGGRKKGLEKLLRLRSLEM